MASALFKYLAPKYASTMIEKGELLFSNLTRFKQMEHAARGDVMEGCHVDNPDNDVEIEVVGTGRRVTGPFSFRNSVNDEKVFAYCLSRQFNPLLYTAFNAESCVEILDVDEFARRCARAIRRLTFVDPEGLIHKEVYYFRPNANCELDPTTGRNIPFLKHFSFADQDEYRFVFGRQGALRTKQRIIINRDWNTEPDHLRGAGRTLLLKIGPLNDITKLHCSSSV